MNGGDASEAAPLDNTDQPHDLSEEELQEVAKRKSAPAKVVHEIVRQEGIEELERPLASLIWSGVAAGVTIYLSLIAQAALMLKLPPGPAREPVAAIGYSVGFIVVILGRLQLFTESTITAVLPVAAKPSLAGVGQTLRLWSAVFVANLLGTLIVALLVANTGVVSSELLGAMIEVSQRLQSLSAWATFLHGIPAGFILATIAWVLPSVRGQEIWLVGLLTYFVSLAGFSHVIAGSAEAWILAATGTGTWRFALLDFTLPALAGNIVGGTGLFAVLAHAQVRSEL